MAMEHAARARALIGTRFRPQGRDPETGVDCVGLVICTFALLPGEVRRDYRLRGDHREEVMAGLSKRFRRIAVATARPGDVLVLRVSAGQLHLGVTTIAGFVHADACRRKVVEMPGPPPWPVIAAYRKRKTS